MPTPKLSNVDRAVKAVIALTETELVEFDLAVKYFRMGRGQQPEKRAPGRPQGSKNKPTARVNGAAENGPAAETQQ